MKTLCATDFSKSSKNAIRWIYQFLNEHHGGILKILHCVDTKIYSGSSVLLEDILKEKAESDMKILKETFPSTDKVVVQTDIQMTNPKLFISNYAKPSAYDLIVTGTTGLTNLKDMLVGSVTEYFINHADVPVLTIPKEREYVPIETVVLGLGKDEMNDVNGVRFFHDFMKPLNANLHMVQVLKANKNKVSVDYRIEDMLNDLNYKFTVVDKDGDIKNSLHNYCDKVNSNLLCLIHKKRSWFGNLWQSSNSKNELFKIDLPLLVLNG